MNMEGLGFFNVRIWFTGHWLECSPIARETWVQSQVESYQRLKKWYLMPPCLTLSIIRYGSRVKWSNPGKGIAPSPTPWCCKLSKRELSGYPRLWSPTLLIWLVVWVLWDINTWRLFNVKSCLYIYICILNIYDLLTHFVVNIFKLAWALFFVHSQMILSISINHLLAHNLFQVLLSYLIQSFNMSHLLAHSL